MDNVFNEYAQYYDLLYKDKDYVNEANFVHKLLKENCGVNRFNLLELGCGTGKHAVEFVKLGYSIHGIDISKEMINEANRRKISNNLTNCNFDVCDIRNFKINKNFDAIISLFHVISYVQNNDDLLILFKNISQHLKVSGIFIFDCWYGPGVLNDKPSVRVKRISNTNIEVVRIAEPLLHDKNNLVDVDYTIFIKDKLTNNIKSFHEKHVIRYFFVKELELMLELANLKIVNQMEWLTMNQNSINTFTSTFIVKKFDFGK